MSGYGGLESILKVLKVRTMLTSLNFFCEGRLLNPSHNQYRYRERPFTNTSSANMHPPPQRRLGSILFSQLALTLYAPRLPQKGTNLGILSHLGILSPIPCRHILWSLSVNESTPMHMVVCGTATSGSIPQNKSTSVFAQDLDGGRASDCNFARARPQQRAPSKFGEEGEGWPLESSQVPKTSDAAGYRRCSGTQLVSGRKCLGAVAIPDLRTP